MPKLPLYPHTPKKKEPLFPHVPRGKETGIKIIDARGMPLPELNQIVRQYPANLFRAIGSQYSHLTTQKDIKEFKKRAVEAGVVALIIQEYGQTAYVPITAPQYLPQTRRKQFIEVGERVRFIGKSRTRYETWPKGAWLEHGVMGTVTEYHPYQPPVRVRGEYFEALEPWAVVTWDFDGNTAILADQEGKRWERMSKGASSSELAVTQSKPTRDDVEVDSWVERDRIGIWIVDLRTDKTIAEWWDEDAQAMFDQGFFKPATWRKSQTLWGEEFKKSVLDYAEEVGLLAKQTAPGRLAQTREKLLGDQGSVL